MRWNVELRKVYNVLKIYQHVQYMEVVQDGRRRRRHQEWQRGQDNFKLAANFGYNSRGSADPRESLRKRRILKLALTAHTVLPTPGARLLLLSTDISTTPTLLLYPIATSLLPICSPHNPFRGQHSESSHLPNKDRQPFAGVLSRDEIQSLEELDSERLSANWHHSSS